MRKLHVVILTLLVVAWTTVVFAAPADSGPAGGPSPASFQQPRWFGSYLNFSQEQRDKMRELRDRFFTDTHDLRYDIRQKRVEVQKLFTDPKADDAALLAKQRELNILKQKLMDMKAQMKIEWRKILTPEQIQKLDRMPKHPGMRHHRPHGMM
jgi:Spy/CpxP family protein refolding chaperone